MKRAVTALASLGIVTALAAPAFAAQPPVYGSVQLKYTVNATAAVSIATNYDPTLPGGPQKATAATINPSVAGVCSAGVVESTATLTFGGITPPGGAGYNGCLYKNALSIGVLSNDALGVKIYEYVDVLAAGTQICPVQNGTALAASPGASTAVANPPAYTASCQVGALGALTAVGAATQGTAGTFGAAGAPATGGTDVVAAPQYTTLVGTPTPLTITGAVNGAAYQFLGQDIQVNVSGAAASGNQTSILTIAVVPQ
ncbi:MAG: hypothetical protein JWO85_2196 [Candidatus Eremiobacteraeota bacterium]|nr:hypothetical protein [Candidatus Eremiobacteraeota bacterium]